MSHLQSICEPEDDERFAYFRSLFYVPEGQIYLDGNSLGLLCKPAEIELNNVLSGWREHGVQGWTDAKPDWFTMAELLGTMLAPLIGSAPEEVIVTNSTTVNLHQAVGSLFQPRGNRNKILCDSQAFPSDLLVLKSQLQLKSLNPHDHLKLVQPDVNGWLNEQTIIDAMTDEVALALLPSVVYTTGQLLDMRRISSAARERNVVIGFDLSHSIGAVRHALDEWDIDFAVWCGYKYLNGGPGSAGGIYVNNRHFDTIPALAGWFSSDKSRQFDFSDTIPFAANAGRFQIGTPNILSMAPLIGSLQLISEAGIDWIRNRSLALTDYLIALHKSDLVQYGYELATPIDQKRRGGHISFIHPEAMRICQVLRSKGVIPDYRPNNIVRLAPVALYNSFNDCSHALKLLAHIVEDRLYEFVSVSRGTVT